LATGRTWRGKKEKTATSELTSLILKKTTSPGRGKLVGRPRRGHSGGEKRKRGAELTREDGGAPQKVQKDKKGGGTTLTKGWEKSPQIRKKGGPCELGAGGKREKFISRSQQDWKGGER